MCSLVIDSRARPGTLEGMGSLAALTHRGCLLCALAYLGGCSGGQTGDSGTNTGGDPVCKVIERREVPLAEAEALGYPVLSQVAQAFGDEGVVTIELQLTAPPSLWLERGLEPPSDRGVPAVVSVRSAGNAELAELEPIVVSADCFDSASPLVDVEIAIDALNATLAGRGTLRQVYAGEVVGEIPGFPPSAEVEFAELGSCGVLLGDTGDEDLERELTCSLSVYGMRDCLDRTPLQVVPTDPQTGLDLRDFIARGLAAFPLDLACEGSARRATLDLEIAFPEDYCGDPGFVPVIVTPQLAALGLSTPLPGYVSNDGDPSCNWIVDQRCQGRVGNALLECIESLPRDEGETPRAEPCTGYAVTFSDPGNEVRITFEEAADATIAIEVVARGFTHSKDIDDFDVRCGTQRVLAP
jgi:hypothetical protein